MTLSAVRSKLLEGLCAMGVAISASSAGQWGSVELPALGIFDLEECTVEAWVLFEFEPSHLVRTIWRGVGLLFAFEEPKREGYAGTGMSIIFGLKNTSRHGETTSACVMRVGFYVEGREVPYPVLPECTFFGKQKWHHIAVSWKEGRYLHVYLDAKLSATRQFPYSVERGVSSKAKFIIGSWGFFRENSVAIDELRISSVAREPEELGYHHSPLLPDPFTLLLVSFENVRMKDSKRWLTPEFMADVSLPNEFEIIGGRLIEGKVGKAFAFNPKEIKK